MEEITIKPHHFLDIIRDFGAGRRHEPHPYGHDVHRVAGIIRGGADTVLCLTAGPDDICAPCRHLDKQGLCTDQSPLHGTKMLKQEYNLELDNRLFERLGLGEGARMKAREFCELALGKLGDLRELYPYSDPEHLAWRESSLRKGLEDYLAGE